MNNQLNYIVLNSTTSTNDEARKLIAENKIKHGSVIRTDFQQNGRGRQNNGWESEPSKNLLVSFVLEPIKIIPEQQFIINQLISTVLCDFVNKMIAENLPENKNTFSTSIKWPNDIYVNDKKIAGILIEHLILGHQIAYSIIGIGLNINQLNFKIAPNPISLKEITKKEFEIDKICEELSKKFFYVFDNFYLCVLQSTYKEMLYHYHQKQRFSIDNKTIEAIICGVSDCGMLQLRFENGSVQEFELNSIKYIL